MKQEEKQLLLQDLCARLPYGVKIALTNTEAYHHENIAKIGDITLETLKGFDGKYFRIAHNNPLDWNWYVSEVNVEDIKPYLFPLSSMTDEQLREFIILTSEDNFRTKNAVEYIDWLNKNHLDYRGLIEKGLAINATELNIY